MNAHPRYFMGIILLIPEPESGYKKSFKTVTKQSYYIFTDFSFYFLR